MIHFHVEFLTALYASWQCVWHRIGNSINYCERDPCLSFVYGFHLLRNRCDSVFCVCAHGTQSSFGCCVSFIMLCCAVAEIRVYRVLPNGFSFHSFFCSFPLTAPTLHRRCNNAITTKPTINRFKLECLCFRSNVFQVDRTHAIHLLLFCLCLHSQMVEKWFACADVQRSIAVSAA